MRTKQKAPDGATVTKWRGYVRFGCTACGYDTLDPDKFADHWRTVHGSLEQHEIDAPPLPDPPAPAGETLVED